MLYGKPVKLTDKDKLPEVVNPNFHPSPTMRVRFADGEILALNRKERRRRGLYGTKITKVTKVRK